MIVGTLAQPLSDSVSLGDTWTWSGTWQQRAGAGPAARMLVSMAATP
jgi:hypothetical protein